MTDEEILHQYIDLSKSHLTHKEKEEVMGFIVAYKKAFSLRDEIGKCPNIKVNIEVNDPSTFLVRPFPIVEEDKPLMDKCMQKLVSLGILTKNSTTHTSPVMLVARKGNERKRPVVDFRLLNTRIVRRNTSTPLLGVYQLSHVLFFLTSSIVAITLLLHFRLTTLYPSSRTSLCIFFLIYQHVFLYILINLKQQRVKIMGKNIQSYATTQVHSPGEGREALRQILQVFQLQM